ELRPLTTLLFAARLDDAVQVLVEYRQVLGLTAGQRPDERGGQGPGGQLPLAEEVAVQDRVLEHADLLGSRQRGLQLLVVAAGRGRGRAQVGEALQQYVEQGRRQLKLDLVATQQFLGAEADDLRLALLVRHDRDADEVEAALERGRQVVDAPVAAVRGRDDREAGLGEHDV